MEVENLILSNLVYNEEYGRKTLPFIKPEYFHVKEQLITFNLITSYMMKYNSFPSKEALFIDLGNIDNLSQAEFDSTRNIISNLKVEEQKIEWLLEKTEKFCQDKAIYNGIMASIQILDDKTGKMSKSAIPDILTEALSVSFDSEVGHNFIDDSSDRFDYYTKKEDKIPFDLDILNKITQGGVVKKSITVFMSSTGVGKSLVMCHMAKNNLLDGKNVLYITLEMSEEKIAERIDANILDVDIHKIKTLNKQTYIDKMNKVREKTTGKLIIKEYPTSGAGASNFRYLLSELRTKQNFTPDIVYIDYLNICCSSRIKMGGSVNSYSYIKAIAEELRGLAIEFNVPVITATQVNRGGMSSTDFGLEDVSESVGLTHTCDLFLGIISTDEMKQMGQVMFKQLKNRYADPSYYNKFVVGIDYAKMRLYNIDEPEKGLLSDKPVMDNSHFNEREENDHRPNSKFNKDRFNSFK